MGESVELEESFVALDGNDKCLESGSNVARMWLSLCSILVVRGVKFLKLRSKSIVQKLLSYEEMFVCRCVSWKKVESKFCLFKMYLEGLSENIRRIFLQSSAILRY